MIETIKVGSKYTTDTYTFKVLAVGSEQVFILTDDGREELYTVKNAKAWWTEVVPFFGVGKTYRYSPNNLQTVYTVTEVTTTSSGRPLAIATAIQAGVTLYVSDFQAMMEVK